MCEEELGADLGIVVGSFQGLGGAGYENVDCECECGDCETQYGWGSQWRRARVLALESQIKIERGHQMDG